MTAFEELPADRQAVLSLLVKQSRTYAQVAGMLKIDPSAVRGRAMDAVGAIGGTAPAGLDDADRERIADYLLGQLDESERIETLALLLDTGSGRAWARRVSGELAPISGAGLPAVPDDPDGPVPAQPAPAQPTYDEDEYLDERPAPAERRPPAAVAPGEGEDGTPAGAGSPLALGVLALAAVLIIAAIVVFATRSSGTTSLPAGPIPASAATATTASTTTTGAATGTTSGTTGNGAVSNTVAMRATSAGGQGTGAVAVLTQNGQKELAFTAQKLATPPAGDRYVLWLYNSASQFEALGAIQSVANGTVSPVAVALPSDAASYTGIILTLESSQSPTRPGQIILQGQSNSPF